MASVKKNERYIPIKNYIIAGIIVVVMILLTWYAFAWYNVYKENRISTSYLVKNNVITKEINDLKEVNDVFSEVPNSYFIYISYTGSEEIYKMEKDISSLIKEYKLNDSMYYLNVTDIKKNDNYIDEINKSLSLEGDNKITQVPTVVYYNDGKVSKSGIIRKNDDNIMNVGDFQKLLDVNNVEKQ